MNLALGRAAIILGFVASSWGVIAMVVGTVRHNPTYLRIGKWCVGGTALGAVLAVVAMERALLTDDFSIDYVARNHSTATPFPFDVATLWAALEGSILLWLLVLAGFLVATARRFRNRFDDPMVGWAMVTMFVVCTFFFMLVLGPANPFVPFDVPPDFDGPGPNPLLQEHILMAFHPPMLYLGYVGFTVPFAFAIGALATGRLGEGWLLETRRWTLVAWGCLTVGIVLGSWWAYEVLGWGGYWAWDPVENASLLPWLTGTAYLHSVVVQERRGMLRVWNLSLLAATFALTILGTFITRSGVLESVHAFTESQIGPLLLGFFALIVVSTVVLIAWRGDELRTPARIGAPMSREGAFLANNLVFAAFAFTVLLGTLFPLLVEAIGGDRISVGSPFFNRMSIPLGLMLLFLMAVAPVLPWKRTSGELLHHRLLWPAWVGTAALVVAVAVGARGLAPLLAFALGGFAAGSAGRQLVLAIRRQGWRGLVGRSSGGMVVHLGVVMIAVALAASGSYLQQTELRLLPDEPAQFAGSTFTLVGTDVEVLPNRRVQRVLIDIDGTGPWAPGVSVFPFGNQRIGTPSVQVTPTRDVALSVLELPSEPGDPALVRVTVQPLIVWLWIGGGVMALGTLMAVVPPRRRPGTPDGVAAGRSEQPETPAAAPTGGAAEPALGTDAPTEVGVSAGTGGGGEQ
ncbi:MAG: heme lyase CcmF/NrfE family subunit [Acidimicrobiia bacterium]|nr:heme lyase CcmF/NrfE family subunit [Acidimicrobiia bacterium]